jgi:hypothetical protein
MAVRASRWIMIVVLVVSGSAAANAQTTAEDAPHRRALDVTFELARRGLNGGVVLCGPWKSDDVPSPCSEINGGIFQRREGGVLHVRTMREPRRVTDLLNRRIELEPAEGVPAIEVVATRIVHAVRGDRSAGRAGSTTFIGRPVDIRGGTTTVMEALDDVVRQVPNLVWYVYFEPKDDGGRLEIGLIGPGGGGGTEIFPAPPRQP